MYPRNITLFMGTPETPTYVLMLRSYLGAPYILGSNYAHMCKHLYIYIYIHAQLRSDLNFAPAPLGLAVLGRDFPKLGHL